MYSVRARVAMKIKFDHLKGVEVTGFSEVNLRKDRYWFKICLNTHIYDVYIVPLLNKLEIYFV